MTSQNGTSSLVQLLMGVALVITACTSTSEPDSAPLPIHELVTEVVLEFTDPQTQQVTTYRWVDSDGRGGADPVVDTIRITAGKEYTTNPRIYTTAGEITSTIDTQRDSHFFEWSGTFPGTAVSFSTGDYDNNGLRYGRLTDIEVDDPVDGTITMNLSHFPDPTQKADGLVGPVIDVEATFPVEVE